jgi:RNA polymerase sigma-70 factor (ECF subfamily)
MQNSATAVNLSLLMNDDLDNEIDEDLMMRYRDGDAAAFEILYSRHKGALFRYFNRQCYEPAIAEELFQDSWMSIIKSRKNYVRTAKFTTYMFTIAHNKLIDFYRRNKIRFADSTKNEDSSSSIEINELAARAEDQPDQILVTQQKQSQLMSAVKLLPETQREVFLLREESGLSLEEIANITDVNMETAKSRLRYAVKSLKKYISAGES